MNANRIRLGLYMFTPMIGGAELYLRDLLWRIDRSRYEVTLFYESWPKFDAFLGLGQCPDLDLCPINVIEPGGHVPEGRTEERSNGSEGSSTRPKWKKSLYENALTKLRYLYRKRPLPFAKGAGLVILGFLEYFLLLPINFVRLFLAFRRNPTDILHINNGGYPGAQTARLAAIAAKVAGCQTCIMTVAASPQPVSFPWVFEKGVDWLVHQSLDRIVIPADSLGNELLNTRGFELSRMTKIYWGVDAPSVIIGKPESRLDRDSDLGLLGDYMVVGMVASFLSRKGHRYLVEAVSHLDNRFPRLRVALVGHGPTLPDVKLLVKKLGVYDKFIFLGFLPLSDTLSLMSQFDIFVLPSELEGVPYVVLHAMSLGKPVVTTSVGGNSEIISAGETGIIVPPGDSLALAEALAHLLDDPSLRTRMGLAAYARYQTTFTVNRMIEQHELLYKQLVEKHSGGANPARCVH